MIRVGPAGSGGLGNPAGLRKAARMGFGCLEVEFTYGVRMAPEAAVALGALAAEKNILLSVHAPYYINLASDDPEKAAASKKRILDSCARAAAMGAQNVVLHAGFYQHKTARQTFKLIESAVLELQEIILREGWRVQLCPEVTGKPSQFGSLEELLELKAKTGCGLTVDFAHLYARQQGAIDYAAILSQLPQKFHAHFSGITFGAKGEKKHVATTEIFFKPLAKELIKKKPEVTLINESPQPYRDAAMMDRVLKKLVGV